MAIRHYAQHHAANIDDVIHHLEFSVDLLEKPKRIKDLTDHDPAVYGLIVEGRGRQGVVLPGRTTAATADEQLALALDKAGLKADEAYTMSRFRVERHAELFRPAW
jgi:AMMECR1 domain-containing protein